MRGRYRVAPALAAIAFGGLLAGCASRPGAGPVVTAPPPGLAGDPAASVVAIARSLLAAPYRFAGTEPHGFDCSGFTAYVFARVGRTLPRTASEQARAGSWIPLDELRPGDLVFFGERRDRVSHVGLVVSPPGQPLAIIHAAKSRGVVETPVLENTYWLGRLQLAQRVLTGERTARSEPLASR